MQSISVLILLLIVVFDIKLFLNTFSLTNHEISNGIHIKYCPASRLSLNKSWLSSGRHEFRPYLVQIFSWRTGSILKRSLKAFFNSGLVANLGTLKVITPSSLSTLAFSVIRGIFKRARQSTPAFSFTFKVLDLVLAIKLFCGYICLLRLSRKDCQAFLRFGNQNVFRIEKKNGIEVSNIFYSDRRYISKAFKNFWII